MSRFRTFCGGKSKSDKGSFPRRFRGRMIYFAEGSERCLGRESNPHEPFGPPDFKSGASASSATQARVLNESLTRFQM